MRTKNIPVVLSCVQSNRLAVEEIFTEISTLENEYPEFKQWFFDKVVPGCIDGTRKIIEARVDGQVAGVLILKDSEEKKICTLRVSPNFRNMGIGRLLLECAIIILKTPLPTITVSDEHFDEYLSLLESFGFRVCEVHINYYRPGHSEYVFNGSL